MVNAKWTCKEIKYVWVIFISHLSIHTILQETNIWWSLQLFCFSLQVICQLEYIYASDSIIHERQPIESVIPKWLKLLPEQTTYIINGIMTITFWTKTGNFTNHLIHSKKHSRHLTTKVINRYFFIIVSRKSKAVFPNLDNIQAIPTITKQCNVIPTALIMPCKNIHKENPHM